MRKSNLSLAAGLILVAASSAQAQGYVGGNVGWAKISVDCGGLDNCDRSSTGYKAYGGYRFGEGFAVEGVYFDWGKATASGQDDYSTFNADLKASGWGLGVAYFLPFATDFSGVARLGAVRNQGKLRATDTYSSMSDSNTTNSWQVYGGIGVAYNVMPNLAITAEADFSRVKYGAAGETDTSTVQMYTFGVRFSF